MSSESLQELLGRAEVLYRDCRLHRVRQWKQETGGLAVGYLPIYVPREILHAQGVLPVGLMGGGDDLEVIRGDAYYQSYICRIPRSTIELGLNGSLDCLDGVIFPAICDVIRNLSEMWKILFPDKLVRYLDLPQDFGRDLGGEFFRRELEELSAHLVVRGARALRDEWLRQSIAAYNDNRRLVRQLCELRHSEPWKVPASEFYLLMRAGLVVPVEEHTRMLEAYRGLVAASADRKPMDQARVVMTGCFCEQPPLGLIKTLERAGCYIVDDDLVQIHRWIRGDIALEGDPLENCVVAFLENSIASPTRYIGPEEKGKDLVQRVRDSGAEGVLFCGASFCDPALLDQPMGVAAVEAAGIPWTAFKYGENTGQFQVIREHAGTFADSIRLWSAP